MAFQKLDPETIRLHKGRSFIGITTVFVCHDGEGNVLFAKRSKNARDERGSWEFGAGGMKHGSSVEENVRREINEEYGVKPKNLKFVGYWDVFRPDNDGTSTHWLAFAYSALVDKTKVKIGEPEMIDELIWSPLSSLPNPLHSQMKPFIKQFSSELRAQIITK